GITRVTTPWRSMRTKALGANPVVTSVACPRRSRGGRANARASPPPAAAAPLRKPRRGVSEPSGMVVPSSRSRRAVDRGADALIGAATADIAGHGGVDIGVARLGCLDEQGRGRHDLAGLAIAALHHIEIHPGLLQRLALRRVADRLDRGDRAFTDAV